MKTIQRNTLNYRQILSYTRQLSSAEKEKLFYALRKERLQELLTQVRRKTKEFPLSFEEITEEVESVRRQRYENQKSK